MKKIWTMSGVPRTSGHVQRGDAVDVRVLRRARPMAPDDRQPGGEHDRDDREEDRDPGAPEDERPPLGDEPEVDVSRGPQSEEQRADEHHPCGDELEPEVAPRPYLVAWSWARIESGCGVPAAAVIGLTSWAEARRNARGRGHQAPALVLSDRFDVRVRLDQLSGSCVRSASNHSWLSSASVPSSCISPMIWSIS